MASQGVHEGAPPLPMAPSIMAAGLDRSPLRSKCAQERKFKLQSCRKSAVAAQKSNKDFESRQRIQQEEEEKAIVKRAKWIASEASSGARRFSRERKSPASSTLPSASPPSGFHMSRVRSDLACTAQVMAFWKKAERVVMHRYQTEVDRKKKEVLDKHLEFLVGQTERWVGIPTTLPGVHRGLLAWLAPYRPGRSPARPRTASSHRRVAQTIQLGAGLVLLVLTCRLLWPRSPCRYSSLLAENLKNTAAQQGVELETEEELARQREIQVMMSAKQQQDGAMVSAAAVKAEEASAPGDADFVLDGDLEELAKDDEATLEEEELLAMQEGDYQRQQKEELDALQAEARISKAEFWPAEVVAMSDGSCSAGHRRTCPWRSCSRGTAQRRRRRHRSRPGKSRSTTGMPGQQQQGGTTRTRRIPRAWMPSWRTTRMARRPSPQSGPRGPTTRPPRRLHRRRRRQPHVRQRLLWMAIPTM